jgi:lipoprotein signal peptidase
MSEAEAPASKFPPKWRVFVIVSVLSLVADQVTKIWARGALPVQGTGGIRPCSVPEDLFTHACQGIAKPVVDGFWDWRLSMNPGSAFGLFASNQAIARVFLSLVGIGAVIGMIYMLRKSRTDQRVLHWALALVAGGAVGNLIDRIYFGYVTDFILWRYHAHEWPTFNVADVVLVVGVGLMFIDLRKEDKANKAGKAARKATAQDKARAEGLVKKGL